MSLEDTVGDGVRSPGENEATLQCESVRMSSPAALQWCGGCVSLARCVFTQSSILDKAREAASPPILLDVDRLDGDKLRIGQVDLRKVRLADAATFGVIDTSLLAKSAGPLWRTRRRVLFDEEEHERHGTPSGARLAVVYRALRKSSEQAGDYAGANDLHYGERRWQLKATTSRAERCWLQAYRLVGYGVRPWRPLALLMVLVVAAAASFDFFPSLLRQRTIDASPATPVASACARSNDPKTPGRTFRIECRADASERLEFSLRATTSLIRPVGGYEVRGHAVLVEVFLRLTVALLFALFVLALRNRFHR